VEALFVEVAECFLCVADVDDEVLCDQHAVNNVPATTKATNLPLPEKIPLTANSCTPLISNVSRNGLDCGGNLCIGGETFLFMH
jgi:hypothetical protein